MLSLCPKPQGSYTPNPKPQTLNHRVTNTLYTLGYPIPHALYPIPQTLILKTIPQTITHQTPQTPNPKPKAPNPKPYPKP